MVDESTVSDAGNNAPLGAVVSDNTDSVQPDNDENQPLDLDENRLIRVKGSDKPVKFGEYGKQFQAQFTKASQEAARLRDELAKERAERQRYEQEKARQGQPPAQKDVYAGLRELPYLSGEEAASMAQSISQEIRERDRITMALVEKIQSMESRLGGLYDNHTTNSFNQKIDKWVTDLGYGPEARDIAQEIYLAYEGNDLDQEFPRIFSERMQQLEQIFENKRRNAVDRARRQPFVPGQGGNAGPSRPLQFKGSESARDITEQMWPLFNASGT